MFFIDSAVVGSVEAFSYTDDPEVFALTPNDVIKGVVKINIVIQYHCSRYCSGGIIVTFLGKDLDVVPVTLVIEIVDHNMDSYSITSMLVERYNIVSNNVA